MVFFGFFFFRLACNGDGLERDKTCVKRGAGKKKGSSWLIGGERWTEAPNVVMAVICFGPPFCGLFTPPHISTPLEKLKFGFAVDQERGTEKGKERISF